VIARRVTVEEARPFWADPSQHVMGAHPDMLPGGDGFHYWASGPVCGVFHPHLWPGVWMVHIGCKPSGWGIAADYARAGLLGFWADQSPQAVVAWVQDANRAVLALMRRVGFQPDGVLRLPPGDVNMQSWRP
jgi:RimJ/RimL family protein N-acetyltransferase